MIIKKIHLFPFLLASGFFVFDRILKYLSLYYFTAPKLSGLGWGWQPFLNPGVAFGLILPNWLIIPFSVIIILLIIFLIIQCDRILNCAALGLVLAGAVSNLFDRLYFNQTVDYFSFLNAVFNLADILIVIGLILFIFSYRQAPPSTGPERGAATDKKSE